MKNGGYMKTAPWLDLVHSDYHDYLGQGQDQDRLEDPRWLVQFMSHWNLAPKTATCAATRRQLAALRDLLQRMARRLDRNQLPGHRDLKRLNSYLARGRMACCLQRQGQRFHLRWSPASTGLNAALTDIAWSFADVLISGDPCRVKICENPDCRWVFYDNSKNRTRRWCEGPGGCGNLIKVRRYRDRHRR